MSAAERCGHCENVEPADVIAHENARRGMRQLLGAVQANAHARRIQKCP
jgi:hypothetical protein